ncbi:uncharacterized protein [Penaeus vannamei]|uniref:uncharacterized protein n=1 Tax=Penaeus vannamei TaxID=6689 RepID=UPI00387F3B11
MVPRTFQAGTKPLSQSESKTAEPEETADQLVKDTKLDMATPQEDHFQAGNDDLGDGSDDSGEPNVLERGEADVPPSLPPPLTPHPSSPSQHSPGNQELQYLIHYLQVTRISDEERRRQDEEARRVELQEYRLQMEQQRQLNDERFMQLLSMIAPKPLQVQQTSPEQQAPAAHQLSPVPPFATTSGSPHAPITAPVMGKPMIPSPPQLQSDVTYQLFRQWRRKFEDYSVLMGLHSLPPATQHIYLRTCVSLEVQRLLHYTLAIPPDSSMPVVQVLDALQQYFRNSQNEALRRRELLSCKQTPGEPFSAFYARMKDLADESELCTGDRTTCAATQLKMILLMGVCEEELVQRLVSLDSQASLDDFVTCCRTFESSRAAASAIVAAPSQLNILSSYKRNQHRQKMTATTKHTPQRCQSPPLTKDSLASCRSCTHQHAVGHCPAKNSTCPNCGYKGHWHRTPRCPAKDSECTTCHKQGHFAKCCKSTRKTSTNQTCRARRVSTSRTPKPVNVTLSYGSKSSQLLMLPDTGADITMIGPKHLDSLGIPRCNLSPPPATDVLTADGSSMTPALGCFETTLQLGQASCKAIVHDHEDIQTPLLSYGHCVDLAIVSTDFQKPILSVTHVNRCAQQMPASAMSSPTTARTYFLQHFSDVLVSKTDLQTTPLKMSGPPMRIHLQPGVTPFAIHTPRPIPFTYRDQVKEELDSLVQQGIISPVGDKPSEWYHPMVLVPKPGNGVRITVDLTHLNSQVSRPTHPSPTPADAIRTITPSAKFFTKADALHGYWQMDLAEEDRHLTTFITPHGRYYHCRGPMGFAATGDAYCLLSHHQDHDQAFGKVKAAHLSPPVLAPFNPKLPVTLQTDASRLYGLGYALFQEHGHSQLRLVQCGSRFLTDAESRYATIELEMLAASWAMGKCRLYLAGLQHFTLHTDHRPLIPILNHYTLDAIENPRLQHLRVKMAPYVFTAVWHAGKTLCVPDGLSRAPVGHPTFDDEEECTMTAAHVRSLVSTNATSTDGQATAPILDDDRTLQELRAVASKDQDYRRLLEYPPPRYQQQEPYLCNDQPSRPFESVSADFFQVAGKSFLVIVDRLSGWPVVTPCGQDTTATKVMRMFCMTDGGTPFTSEEFRRFTERWGIHHLVASPHYPQSNGHAEAAVKSVKYLILKMAPDGNIDCEAFDRGLLELRNNPTPAGRSPAQILYGYPLRTCVPAHPQSFSAQWQTKSDDWDRCAAAQANQVTNLYDSHARPLPRLSVGQRVRIQDHKSLQWDKVGVVMGCGRSRQYEVRLSSGRVWWRNRRHLCPVPVPKCEPSFLSPVSPCQDQETGSLHVPPVTPRRSPRLVAKSPVSARDTTTSVKGGGV